MVCTMVLEYRFFELLLLIVGCMRSFGGRSLFHFLDRMSVGVLAPYCLSVVVDTVLGSVVSSCSASAPSFFMGASSKSSCSFSFSSSASFLSSYSASFSFPVRSIVFHRLIVGSLLGSL